MPAPDIVSVTVTRTEYPPQSTAFYVDVSIHRRIYRQATKLGRAHQLEVTVTYDSIQATTVTIPATVMVSATTFVGKLPDKRREVRVSVPLGGNPEPGASPNFQSTAALILQPKGGTERDDDEGNDDSIDDATYDIS